MQHFYKDLGVVVHTCNPTAGQADSELRVCEKPISKNKVESDRERNLTVTAMHALRQTDRHMHTRTRSY